MNVPLNIEEFIKLAGNVPVIDVRSPGEFAQGHIPGAHNIPLFDNEERAKVGTAYKQVSREKAIEIGYELANPKINSFLEQVKKNSGSKTIRVHCWRGGMRSSKFAELLNKHGYKTHTLVRGYKAYRNFVLKRFETNVNILILGGETGSGKTEILKKISEGGEQVVDLEKLANHKGSAFGSLGEDPQPTQEQFENDFSDALSHLDLSKRVWMEDESRSIGRTQIPNAVWEKMKQAPILRIHIPKSLRIQRLMNDYGNFSKDELKSCILKIRKRLGPNDEKRALEELEKNNLQEVADITLTYYDKAYNYAHETRSMKDVFFIESATSDAAANAERIISFANLQLQKTHA